MDKDNKLTKEERQIIQLYDKDMTVDQNAEKIAKIFGKSTRTITNTIYRLRKNKHMPKSRPKILGEKVENIIKALIQKEPRLTSAKIKAQLEDQDIHASLSTVEKACHKIRKSIEDEREEQRRQVIVDLNKYNKEDVLKHAEDTKWENSLFMSSEPYCNRTDPSIQNGIQPNAMIPPIEQKTLKRSLPTEIYNKDDALKHAEDSKWENSLFISSKPYCNRTDTSLQNEIEPNAMIPPTEQKTLKRSFFTETYDDDDNDDYAFALKFIKIDYFKDIDYDKF